MQLMPETASFLADNPAIAVHPKALQSDPSLNLDLGQRYVAYLAAPGVLGGDLIRVLASYNCGPSSFAKWSAQIRDGGDPLLFIEAIPIPETRLFVQRALTYTWIYAARLHVPAPSLIELAAGVFPRVDTAAVKAPAARLH
jgi:soluble lytic murein transglycosylase-like protein